MADVRQSLAAAVNGLFDIVFTATSGAVYWAGASVLSKSNATHASTSQGRCCRQESRRIETFAPANLSACCTTKRRSMGRHITRGLALRSFPSNPAQAITSTQHYSTWTRIAAEAYQCVAEFAAGACTPPRRPYSNERRGSTAKIAADNVLSADRRRGDGVPHRKEAGADGPPR